MLTEDQLKDMVFDLGAARKGELNENILQTFFCLKSTFRILEMLYPAK